MLNSTFFYFKQYLVAYYSMSLLILHLQISVDLILTNLRASTRKVSYQFISCRQKRFCIACYSLSIFWYLLLKPFYLCILSWPHINIVVYLSSLFFTSYFFLSSFNTSLKKIFLLVPVFEKKSLFPLISTYVRRW